MIVENDEDAQDEDEGPEEIEPTGSDEADAKAKQNVPEPKKKASTEPVLPSLEVAPSTPISPPSHQELP